MSVRHFVFRHFVCSTFCPLDILSVRHFVCSTFCLFDILSVDILSVRHFVCRHYVRRHFVCRHSVCTPKLRGCRDTAEFIQIILNLWNVVNVSGKGQDQRMNDPYRTVQDHQSTNLQTFLAIFQKAASGHGTNRIKCFTHDTKKALVQTMQGVIDVSRYLFRNTDFQYVLLRENQSDRLEGEFSVYRQSTGANSFMTTGDVFSACKRHLTRYAATNLQSIDVHSVLNKHTCLGTAIDLEDAAFIERCTIDMTLTVNNCAVRPMWRGGLRWSMRSMCFFSAEEPLVTSDVKDFIEAVSRGTLTTPHMCTFDLVRCGLCFIKEARHRSCSQERLMEILSTLASFSGIDIDCPKMFRRLVNVLLNGLHNLEKDQQKNAVLLQTSVKKTRLTD